MCVTVKFGNMWWDVPEGIEFPFIGSQQALTEETCGKIITQQINIKKNRLTARGVNCDHHNRYHVCALKKST